MLRAAFFAALLFFPSCGDTYAPPIEMTYTLTREVVQKGVPVHIKAKGIYQEAADGIHRNQAEILLLVAGEEVPIKLKLIFISNPKEEWLISESSVVPGRQVFRFEVGAMQGLGKMDEGEKTQFFGPADFNPVQMWNASEGEKSRLPSGARSLKEEFLALTLSEISLSPSFEKGAFQFTPAENDEILDGAKLLGL